MHALGSLELGVVRVVEQLGGPARHRPGDRLAAPADERRARHEAALLAMVSQRLPRPGSKSPVISAGSSGCGCRRPGILPSTSSIARWTCSPSTAMRSSRRCSGTASTCSSSTSTCSSLTYTAKCDDEDVASHQWRGLTFAPLRARALQSKELYLRERVLSHRLWPGYDDILDACCAAWNALPAPSLPHPLPLHPRLGNGHSGSGVPEAATGRRASGPRPG
jgi:hypothetical protein